MVFVLTKLPFRTKFRGVERTSFHDEVPVKFCTLTFGLPKAYIVSVPIACVCVIFRVFRRRLRQESSRILYITKSVAEAESTVVARNSHAVLSCYATEALQVQLQASPRSAIIIESQSPCLKIEN